MLVNIICGDNVYAVVLDYVPRVGDQIVDKMAGKERLCIVRRIIWRPMSNTVSIGADPDPFWEDSPEGKARLRRTKT